MSNLCLFNLLVVSLREGFLDFFNKTFKLFHPKLNCRRVIEPLQNKGLFQKCFMEDQATIHKRIEKDISRMLRPKNISGVKSEEAYYANYYNFIQASNNYVAEKMGLIKVLAPFGPHPDHNDEEELKTYATIEDFKVILKLLHSQTMLKMILKTISNHEKIDVQYLKYLQGRFAVEEIRLRIWRIDIFG